MSSAAARWTKPCCWLAMVAVVLGVAGAALAQDTVIGENRVANPSFETVPEGRKFPSSWSGDTNVYSLDRTVAHSGAASLKYVNDDPKRYRLAGQRVDVTPGRKYRISAWIKTDKVTGKSDGAKLCLEWRKKDGNYWGGIFVEGVKGTSDWTHVEKSGIVPAEATGFSLSCYVEREMSGTAWFDDVEVVRIAEEPLKAALLMPNYRGQITADGPEAARVSLGLNLVDHDLKPGQMRVRSRLTNAAGQTVAGDGQPAEPTVHAELFSPQGEGELRLPVRGLPPGRYRLTVELLTPEDKVLKSQSFALERMAEDFRPAVTIDSHGRTLLAGRPFFPLGMYWGSVKEAELKRFADSKFNCLMPYHSPDAAQMELIQQAGLKVLYSVKDWYFGSHYCPAHIRSKADEEPKIRERVRQFREHPALLGWYLNDELSPKYMEQLNAHQRWVSEEDPNHPTWVVLCHPTEVSQYLESFDVIGTDPYPIGSRPASLAADWTEETRRQVCGARPIWQVPQVFNWKNYHKERDLPTDRSPTAAEMRSMAWQCIAEGAMGLVFYSWMDLHRNPDVPFDEQWERLRTIVAEIDRCTPILLSVESAPQVTALEAPAWLHWTVRTMDGKSYVIAVNDGDGEGAVRFTLPLPPKSVRTLFEGDPPTTDGPVLRDTLKPLAVQVYEISN